MHNIRTLVAALSFALGLSATAYADEDDDLEKLRASVAADVTPAVSQNTAGSGRAVTQSMNPDIAAIVDVAAASFNVENPMELGEHDPQGSGFTLQQLELNLGAAVDPYFRLDVYIVFTPHGVEVEEAFATSLNLPANLQLRAGEFLTRFGRINNQHPHAWHFIDQPLVLGKFYGGDGDRDIGAELSWLSPLPWYAELIVSGTTSNGRSYRHDMPELIEGLNDVLWTGSLKQFFPFNDDLSLLWGLSGQTAPNNFGGRTVAYGTDLYLRYRPTQSDTRHSLSLQVEAMGRERTLADGVVLRDWGAYAEAVWLINPRWETGARYEYVSGLAADPTDPQWTGPRDRYTLQGTFYPTHFSRVRLQGNAGQAEWVDTWIYGGMISLEVLVGAHGAHVY